MLYSNRKRHIDSTNHSNRRASLCFIVALSFLFNVAQANIVTQTNRDGRLLVAKFKEGNKNLPAVIVLHGFLQTFSFNTTRKIFENIASLDYTVIAPNLSLGISNRLQSLQCHSAHQHTFRQDLKELKLWVNWLKARGHHSIVIIGHSWGAVHSIGYASHHKDKAIKAVIAISLVKFNKQQRRFHAQVRRARKQLRQKNFNLRTYKLSHCNNYTSNPQSFLSYAGWTERKIARHVKKLRRKKFPVYVINGGKDKRSDRRWNRFLRRHTKTVKVVKGANHFFSSVYEFELADLLERVLSKVSAKL